ncbi:hypothetical protein CH252_32985 [Rhodococcus sp. 06-1477-1B]|nr:hypothetical protein CH252_32985 [Rhodococcus sp. 06-1477-1B]
MTAKLDRDFQRVIRQTLPAPLRAKTIGVTIAASAVVLVLSLLALGIVATWPGIAAALATILN